MNVDIIIEVYEYAPHGHGDICYIDDYMDVSDDTFALIKEYHDKGIDDFDSMEIPELDSIISTIKEQHIDFAYDRFSISGGDKEDFSEPDIKIKVAEWFFDEE